MQGFDNLCTSSVVDMCTDRYIERMSTRDLLVDAAADLLQRKGYAGTGVSEVLSASATTKGSLYFHFPGGKGRTRRRGSETTWRGNGRFHPAPAGELTRCSHRDLGIRRRIGCAFVGFGLRTWMRPGYGNTGCRQPNPRSSAVLVRTGTTRGSHCWLSASRQTVGPAKTPSPRQFSLCPHSRARWSLLGRVRIPLRFTLPVGFCPNDCGTRHLGVSALSVEGAVSRRCPQLSTRSPQADRVVLLI